MRLPWLLSIGVYVTTVSGQSYFDVGYQPAASSPVDVLQESLGPLVQKYNQWTGDNVKRGALLSCKTSSPALWNPKKSKAAVDLLARSDSGFVANDLGNRILTVRQEIRNNIDGAVQSVEADIASSNRDNGILALTNFLGAFSGAAKVLTGSSGLANRGDQVLFWAQILYGYGYTFSWVDNFEDANLSCGRADFEAAEPTYAFLDYNPYVDQDVKKYFLTEQANRYKKALYCIISKRGSNSEAKKIDSLIDLHKDLQTEQY